MTPIAFRMSLDGAGYEPVFGGGGVRSGYPEPVGIGGRSSGGGGVSAPVFLSPVLVTDKDGNACWSVTPGTIQNQIPTCNGVKMEGADPAKWATRIAGQGYIYAKAKYTVSESPQWEASIIFSTARNLSGEETTDYYLIGGVFADGADANGKTVWKIAAYNGVSRNPVVTGGAWSWYP